MKEPVRLLPFQFRNKNLLKVWEKRNRTAIKKFALAKRITVNLEDEKETSPFVEILYTTIQNAVKEFRESVTDDMVKIIETAHDNQYKLIKEVNKEDNSISIYPDSYDKFVEMEYGKNIPGVRLVQAKYVKN